jgi:hypothetical protein
MSIENRHAMLLPLLSALPIALGACLGTEDGSDESSGTPTGIRGDSDAGSLDVDGPNGGNRPDPDQDGASSGGNTDDAGGGEEFDAGGGSFDTGGGGFDGGGGNPAADLSDDFIASLEGLCERASRCDPEFYVDFADPADCVASNAADLSGIEYTDPDCADPLQAFIDCIASETTCDEYALRDQCYGAYMAYYEACLGGGYGYDDYGYGDYGY